MNSRNSELNERLVILAGGVSSRMRSSVASGSLDTKLQQEADRLPKSMIGIGGNGRPFLDYLLHNARSAGYREIVLVVGEQSDAIRSFYGKNDRGNPFHGMTISYAVQRIPEGRSKPLGTADALLQALLVMPEWSGSCFTVCNSDNLYSTKALSALTSFAHSGAMIDYDRDSLGVESGRVSQFAVTKKSDDGFLEMIIEKPGGEEIARCQGPNGRVGVSMNLFRFSYDRILPVLQQVPMHPVRSEKELPVAVLMLLQSHPQEIKAIEFTETVPDLTNKDDILRMKELLHRSYPADLWSEAVQ